MRGFVLLSRNEMCPVTTIVTTMWLFFFSRRDNFWYLRWWSGVFGPDVNSFLWSCIHLEIWILWYGILRLHELMIFHLRDVFTYIIVAINSLASCIKLEKYSDKYNGWGPKSINFFINVLNALVNFTKIGSYSVELFRLLSPYLWELFKFRSLVFFSRPPWWNTKHIYLPQTNINAK